MSRRSSSPIPGHRTRIQTLVSLSLAVAATLLLALTVPLCWERVVEWHCLGRLEKGTVEERKEAARRLAAMESREGLERLLVLPPPEPPVLCQQDFYTSVLVEHGESAIPLLFDALRHDDIQARYRSAAVLQQLRPAGATRAIVSALPDWEEPNALLNALAHQNPAPGEAIQALSEAIRSESAAVRAGAADAFRRVKLSREDLLPARQMLEQAVADPDPLVRIYSAWSLGAIGPRPESVAALVTALGDGVGNVRRAAARALAILGPDARAARTHLEAALEDPGSDVRKYAAEALARIRAAEAATPPDQRDR